MKLLLALLFPILYIEPNLFLLNFVSEKKWHNKVGVSGFTRGKGGRLHQGKGWLSTFFLRSMEVREISVQRSFPSLVLCPFFPLNTSVSIPHRPTDVAKQVLHFVLKKNDISSVACPTSVTETSLLLLHNLHILSYVP